MTSTKRFDVVARVIRALFVLFLLGSQAIPAVRAAGSQEEGDEWEIGWGLDKGDVPGSPYYGVYSVYGEGNFPDGSWGVTRGTASDGCFIWFINASLTTMSEDQPYRMLATFTSAYLNGKRPDLNPLFDNAIPAEQRDEYVQWLAETGMRLGPLCPDEPPVPQHKMFVPMLIAR